MHTSQFTISQLRAKSLLAAVESLAVFIMAIFVSALLPSLLFRYVFASQNPFEQPKVLEYIPVVAFLVGMGYFIYAMVGNIQRELKVRELEKNLGDMGCDCEHCDHDHDSNMMAEVMMEKSKKAGKTKRATR